ncbi:SDR family NAD(P)-dependent oxidoreductase [Oleiharenicola lentus]|uniref:SDR family NAD(P)-dependent oxidoreductase n=1 Tax=Oleiharenicola lentus TaxID=2508720 RepID=UPI003F6817E0
MKKIWFITGSARGFGRAITEAVLAAGHSVVATARRPEQLDSLVQRYGARIHPVAMDVTAPAEVQRAVDAAVQTFGRIDVVLNNAGYGSTDAFEDITPESFAQHLDTNFWGVVNVTRAVLPVLRQQGHGHIVQTSSIAGRLAVPGMSAYSAAKFAVEGFSESLAQEIKPLGLHLTLIEPGGFRTDFADAAKVSPAPSAPYAATVGVIRDYLTAHAGQEPGDPRKGAAVILQLAEQANPPLRLPLGSDALVFIRSRYEESLAELNRQEALIRSTDFDDAKVSTTGHAVLDSLAQA